MKLAEDGAFGARINRREEGVDEDSDPLNVLVRREIGNPDEELRKCIREGLLLLGVYEELDDQVDELAELLDGVPKVYSF